VACASVPRRLRSHPGAVPGDVSATVNCGPCSLAVRRGDSVAARTYRQLRPSLDELFFALTNALRPSTYTRPGCPKLFQEYIRAPSPTPVPTRYLLLRNLRLRSVARYPVHARHRHARSRSIILCCSLFSFRQRPRRGVTPSGATTVDDVAPAHSDGRDVLSHRVAVSVLLGT